MNKAGFLLVILVLFCAVSFLGGCCCWPRCFKQDSRPGRTTCENDRRICRSVQLDFEMAWDDWDHLWMIDRPSRENALRVR